MVQDEDSLKAHGGGEGRSRGRFPRKAQNPWCLERAWNQERCRRGVTGQAELCWLMDRGGSFQIPLSR